MGTDGAGAALAIGGGVVAVFVRRPRTAAPPETTEVGAAVGLAAVGPAAVGAAAVAPAAAPAATEEGEGAE